MWKQHTGITTKIYWTCIIRAFRIEFTCISQSGNYFMLLASVSEKQRKNISTDRSGMAPKSAFWFGSSTYQLHRDRCNIDTGFRYPRSDKYMSTDWVLKCDYRPMLIDWSIPSFGVFLCVLQGSLCLCGVLAVFRVFWVVTMVFWWFLGCSL